MTKISKKERLTIITLYDSGHFTMAELARVFGISRGRVSQLVNNNFNELARLVDDDAAKE